MSGQPPTGGQPPQQPQGQPPQGQPPQGGYPPQQGYPPQGSYPPQQSYPPQGGYPPQQGYAPQQGYPPQGGGYPPVAYGGYAPPPGGQPPRSGRLGKVAIIGIAVGAVLLLGLVGLAFAGGAEAAPDDPNHLEPDEPGNTPGPSQPTQEPTPSGTLEPTPVATDAPAPPPPPVTPTEQPEPLPQPTEQPQPTGDSLVLGGTVTVPIVAPWQGALLDGGTQAQFSDDNGSWMWMGLFNGDPSTPANGIIAENFDGLVGADNFTGLQTGEVQAMQTFGAVVSFANISYQGMWSDPQGSIEIAGMLFVAVRSDGQVFALTTESTPPGGFQGDNFGSVAVPALNSFAGTQ